MFVKVVSVYDADASRQTLFEVTEVRFGTVITHLPVNKRDFSQEVGAGFSLLHTPSLINDADGQDDIGDWWLYRYAFWPDARGDNIGVVTSGDLYILNNNGKTIERIVS